MTTINLISYEGLPGFPESKDFKLEQENISFDDESSSNVSFDHEHFDKNEEISEEEPSNINEKSSDKNDEISEEEPSNINEKSSDKNDESYDKKEIEQRDKNNPKRPKKKGDIFRYILENNKIQYSKTGRLVVRYTLPSGKRDSIYVCPECKRNRSQKYCLKNNNFLCLNCSRKTT